MQSENKKNLMNKEIFVHKEQKGKPELSNWNSWKNKVGTHKMSIITNYGVVIEKKQSGYIHNIIFVQTIYTQNSFLLYHQCVKIGINGISIQIYIYMFFVYTYIYALHNHITHQNQYRLCSHSKWVAIIYLTKISSVSIVELVYWR